MIGGIDVLKSSFCILSSQCFRIYLNNYSPQCRWLVVDICLLGDSVLVNYPATFKQTSILFTVCPKEAIPLSGGGKISSTNYPKSNYTASRNCTWNITAPADKIVNFTFTDFVLSECSANPCSDSCSYVELYDGGSTSSPSLGRFCQGSSWNKPHFSNGSQMFVMFHPGQTVARGFEAEYSVLSLTTTTSPSTTTSPPSSPETNATSESTAASGRYPNMFYSGYKNKIKIKYILKRMKQRFALWRLTLKENDKYLFIF